MKSGVYIIKNIVNNKIYIGSSSNSIYNRLKSHKLKLKNNSHENRYLQKAFNKYKVSSFSFEKLEFCLPQNCIIREQYWMNYFNVSNKKYGYNICPIANSRLGIKHRASSKLLMSKNRKGLTCGEKNPMYNKPWSPERREKIMLARAKNLEPILQYSLDGHFIKEFPCARRAEEYLGLIRGSTISKSCKGVFFKSYGYKWKYKNINIEKENNKDGHNIKVYQYSLDGKFIKEFLSHKLADEETGSSLKTYFNSPNRLTSAGYRWSKNKLNFLLPLIKHNKNGSLTEI